MRKLLLISIVFIFLNCNITGDPVFEEIERVTSPDGKVDAVLVQSQHSLSSDGYFVYLVIHKESYKKGHENFVADNVKDLELEWIDNKKLVLSYSTARIFNYSNFWRHENLDNWNYVVQIKLNPLEDLL